MAEDKPSLHIDTDWKKQAQEEKKRLVEQEAKRAQEQQRPPTPPAPPIPGLPPEAATPTSPRAKSRTAAPEASFASHIQSVMTQVLYYLGDLAPRGSEPQLNLDLAKHHIDTLGMLEQKTKSNLTPDEQRSLDAALYETRMRFVSVASQLMGP